MYPFLLSQSIRFFFISPLTEKRIHLSNRVRQWIHSHFIFHFPTSYPWSFPIPIPSVSKMFHAIHIRTVSSSDISTLWLWISFLSTGLPNVSISFPSSQKTKSFPCPSSYQEDHKMGRISHVPLTFPFHPLLIHPHTIQIHLWLCIIPIPSNFLLSLSIYPLRFLFQISPLWIVLGAISAIR